nr:hypothetical protein [Pandoravirus belohorizontensis]
MSNLANYLPQWLYQDRGAWVARGRKATDRETKRQALLWAGGATVPQDQHDRLCAACAKLAVIVDALGKQKVDWAAPSQAATNTKRASLPFFTLFSFAVF